VRGGIPGGLLSGVAIVRGRVHAEHGMPRPAAAVPRAVDELPDHAPSRCPLSVPRGQGLIIDTVCVDVYVAFRRLPGSGPLPRIPAVALRLDVAIGALLGPVGTDRTPRIGVRAPNRDHVSCSGASCPARLSKRLGR